MVNRNRYNRRYGVGKPYLEYIETLSVPLYIADEEAKSHHGIRDRRVLVKDKVSVA
jgi:hypothetical protein